MNQSNYYSKSAIPDLPRAQAQIQEEQAPQVPVRVARLECQVDRLGKNLELIRERLASVFTSRIEGVGGEKAVKESLCPLAERIDASATKLELFNEQLEKLLRDIQL